MNATATVGVRDLTFEVSPRQLSPSAGASAPGFQVSHAFLALAERPDHLEACF
jgi:hypothetical protein